MKKFVIDCEVFLHDWVVVIKELFENKYYIFNNNEYELIDFLNINKNNIFIGFNILKYDRHIIKAIYNKLDNTIIKTISDNIISQNLNSYEVMELIKNFLEVENRYPAYFKLNVIDLKQDMSLNLSLKAIEGHLKIPIDESDVDFNLQRPLSVDETEATVRYCIQDVRATEKLYDVRHDYVETKLALAEMGGIDEKKALMMTNASLSAEFLKAETKNWFDARDYKTPDNLKKSLLPKTVVDFFDLLHDKSIPDDEIFDKKLKTNLLGLDVTYGFGGLHGVKKGYQAVTSENRKIFIKDVNSMYPTIMINYDFISRNIPNYEDYIEVYHKRLKAKKEKDKKTDSSLKLVLNITYGACKNKYNKLYDSLMATSVCITGQLALTLLMMMLNEKCKSIEFIEVNTDDVIYVVDTNEVEIANKVCEEWEKHVKMTLSTEEIDKILIKDVNNLIYSNTKGEIKKRGGYLNYGINPHGSWTINNNFIIVKEAVAKYLLFGTSIEETIYKTGDIFDFQIISNTTSKYESTHHSTQGELIKINKVNRVYASKYKNNGTLYKRNIETKALHKFSGLPDNCVVDNQNKLSIEDVDIEWYVNLAKKYVMDYQQKRNVDFDQLTLEDF